MKSFKSVFVLTLWLLSVAYFCQPIATIASSDCSKDGGIQNLADTRFGEEELSQAIQSLSIRLQRQFLKAGETNPLFSPFNILTAMSMAQTGADGANYAEMAKVLFGKSDVQSQDLAKAWHSTLKEIESRNSENFILSSAQGIFAKSGFAIEPTFVDLNKQYFNAEVQSLNMTPPGNEAVQFINRWVSEKTREKIRSIVKAPLKEDTRLFLISALYLKARWKNVFDKSMTHPATFKNPDGESFETAMMSQTKRFSYLENTTKGYSAISLPYQGDEVDFMVFLPNLDKTVANIAESLDESDMNDLSSTRPSETIVMIPRFKVEWERQLVSDFSALGMNRAFSDASGNFLGISKEEDLKISEIIHKTFFEINEEESEGGAVTSIGMVLTTSFQPRPEPNLFRADHPFVFVVRDRKTKLVLFQGIMNSPERWTKS